MNSPQEPPGDGDRTWLGCAIVAVGAVLVLAGAALLIAVWMNA